MARSSRRRSTSWTGSSSCRAKRTSSSKASRPGRAYEAGWAGGLARLIPSAPPASSPHAPHNGRRMIRDVLIVGAGPSGLATAIAAKMAGLDYAVVEKGALVNSIFNFPQHMVFFTTPELLEIGRLPLVTPYD